MKKHLLLVSTLAITMLSAQNNEGLKRAFEKQNKENSAKFDNYVAKRYGTTNRDLKVQQEIEEQKSTLAGFTPDGKPFFLKNEDMDQIKNSNSDFLQNGTVTGLTGSFNGENIKYTIFDGGRVFGGHVFFNNGTNRISNKEASTMNYSAHATGVAGFVGAKTYSQLVNFSDGTSKTINFQGIAKNSTIDSYAFRTSTLPGDTSTSTVFQKILTAQPKISNHSYGSNAGWDVKTVNGSNAWVWGGVFDSPNTSFDLQGTYFSNDQNYDAIVYNNPTYIIVKSSGNYFGYGPSYPTPAPLPTYYTDANNALVQFAATDTAPASNCAQGFDCIGPGSLAKNIIVVGATDIITANSGRYTVPGDVVHSDYSSAGPRDDGGIKPDISTVGTNVGSASTAEDTTGSQSLTVGSGTSYSAPVVTGIIGLWTQINKQLFNNAELNAAAAKTLMIHSAAEAGNIGPDPWFGWGFIDAKKGAELLVGKSNNTVIFNNETLNNGTVNTKNILATGDTPIKVTISWIDPEYKLPAAGLTWNDAHNNRTSRLVNDLDVRITDVTTNTVYMPWKLNATSPMTPAIKGDNTVDNVEQVVIDAPVAGRTYKIEISHKGTLKNNATPSATAPQDYSIIVTGFNQVLGTQDTKTSVFNELAIAPSVTKDITNILKAPGKSTFTVYDTSGRKLQNGTVNSDKEAVDLSTYTKGIYIIEVKTGKEVISKKVIKE